MTKGDRLGHRFVSSSKEGRLSGTRIITDSETGIEYLFAWDGYAGGLTVLLDKTGKPSVSKDYKSSFK